MNNKPPKNKQPPWQSSPLPRGVPRREASALVLERHGLRRQLVARITDKMAGRPDTRTSLRFANPVQSDVPGCPVRVRGLDLHGQGLVYASVTDQAGNRDGYLLSELDTDLLLALMLALDGPRSAYICL